MLDLFSFRPETRYGCPAADQILINRFYTVGYSYYFRQAKWALAIVDPDKKDLETVERVDTFRPDYRIPRQFRADLSDYKRSGFDRGHLIPSADLRDEVVQNSETFLLSNMCPQKPNFNRQIWRVLEENIRELDAHLEVLETYVITGPIFDFDNSIEMIGEDDENGLSIPVPSHFFKCVLTVNDKGRLHMWAFEMPNDKLEGEVEDYQVTTSYVERRVGMALWDNLKGPEMEKEKKSKRRMWENVPAHVNP